MKVLIACEESQRVCLAFRAKGHEAFSNDIMRCSGGGATVSHHDGCKGNIKWWCHEVGERK